MKSKDQLLFNPRHIRTLLNIQTHTWNSWTSRGFLIPTHKGTGSGSSNVYTYRDVIKIKLMMDLSTAGMKIKQARDIAYSVEVEDGFDTMDEHQVNVFLTGAVVLNISLSDIVESLK